MLRLRIKLVFRLFLFISSIHFAYPQGIYIDNSNTEGLFIVSSYSKHDQIQSLYDYSIDLRLVKNNFEFSAEYYMNKQNLDNNDYRSNEFNIYSFKYYYKVRNKIILGFKVKDYRKYKSLENIQSYSFLLSKNFYSSESDLSYYPYIEYEKATEENILFAPDYFYIGCVIKDGNLFVEPFIRKNNSNDEKYSGIKLGFEI